MEDLRKTVLLYSGGMDSYIISKLHNFDKLLYIDIGGSYSQQEIANLPEEVEVVKLDLSAFEREDKIVPLRNLFFCEIATNYGDRIILGATAGDRVLDKSFHFADLTSILLSFLYKKQHWTEERKISVELPYKDFTKSQMIEQYLEEGHTLEELAEESFSCYEPVNEDECCYFCKPCFRKYIALKKMGYDHGVTIDCIMQEYLKQNKHLFVDRKEEWAEIQEVMSEKI